MATDDASAINNAIEQGPSSPGNHSGTDSGSYSSMQWLVAWVVFITVMIFLARTRIGYLLIYYGLALLVLFLLVTQYKWFATVLAPFRSLRPGVVTGDTSAATSDNNTTPAVGATPGAAAAQQFVSGS